MKQKLMRRKAKAEPRLILKKILDMFLEKDNLTLDILRQIKSISKTI